MKMPIATKAQVAALKPPAEGQALYWDSGAGALQGFGVRVTANGKKAYVVQARVGGNSRRVVLGACDLLPLVEARKRAQKALTTLSIDGVDITAQKREAVAADKREAESARVRGVSLREVMEQ